jgi:hypothetical protein
MWEKLRNFSTEEIELILRIAQIALIEDESSGLLNDLPATGEDFDNLYLKVNNFIESL